MTTGTYPLYKKVGETPLMALERLRLFLGLGSEVPMTYAGRLDPLAEGVLLILVGETCKEKEQYLAYDKIYEATILLGVSSDTYDILGVLTESEEEIVVPELYTLENFFDSALGTHEKSYPKFSSKRLAREDDEELLHETTLHRWDTLTIASVDHDDLVERIERTVEELPEGFRKEEILRSTEVLTHADYPTLSLILHTGTGFYVRTLAHEFGEHLSTGAVLYALKRVRLGPYGVEDCVL
jgi:tRNA pseudouridine55 synthase